MKLNLTYVFLAFVFCTVGQLLVGNNANADPAVKSREKIVFNSVPEGVRVTVLQSGKRRINKTCKTPCSLRLKTNKVYKVSYMKVGYEYKQFDLPNFASWSKIHNKTINLLSYEDITQMKYVRNAKMCHIADYSVREDSDAKPCYSKPLTRPPHAKRSGFCDMMFDVEPTGKLVNIQSKCTEKVFVKQSVRTLKKWVYFPKIVNGKPVHETGLTMRLEFQLYNGKGEKIPSKKMPQ